MNKSISRKSPSRRMSASAKPKAKAKIKVKAKRRTGLSPLSSARSLSTRKKGRIGLSSVAPRARRLVSRVKRQVSSAVSR